MAKTSLCCLLLALGPCLARAQATRSRSTTRLPPSATTAVNSEMQAYILGAKAWQDWSGDSPGGPGPLEVPDFQVPDFEVDARPVHDCFKNYSNWQVDWSEEKKSYCCTRSSRGCSSGPFNCDAQRTWEHDWSDDKKAWCCGHGGRGCAVGDRLFDCQSGMKSTGDQWQEEKMAWCCATQSIGCTTTSTTSTATTTTNTMTTSRAVVTAERLMRFDELNELGAVVRAAQCAQREITWEPIDMPNQTLSIEKDIASCQARCASVPACAHYTFWLGQGHCHLQSAYAVAQHDQRGFISGPPSCHQVEENVATMTTLAKQSGCYKNDTAYEMLDMLGELPTFEKTIIECQARCAKNPKCLHFTYHAWYGTCHISDATAVEVPNMYGHVAGPAVCLGSISLSVELKNLDYDLLMRPSNGQVMADVKGAIKDAVFTTVGAKGLKREDIVVELSGGKPSNFLFKMRKLELSPARARTLAMQPRVIAVITMRPPVHRSGDGVADTLATTPGLSGAVAAALRKVDDLSRIAVGPVRVSQVEDIAFKADAAALAAEQKFQVREAIAGSPLQPDLFAGLFVAFLGAAACGAPLVFKRWQLRRAVSINIAEARSLISADEGFGTETIQRLPGGASPPQPGYGPVVIEM